MKIYEKFKTKMGKYAFEIGLLIGVFIAANNYRNSTKLNRKYIVDAMEHATIKVKNV